jgi:hypothetical protein
MPTPAKFSPAEHLQDTIRRTLNPEVKEWFRDVPDDPDINTPRASLRVACIHLDADSLLMTKTRMLFFEFLCRKPWRAASGSGESRGSNLPPRLLRPRIVLVFHEDDSDVEPGYSPVVGEIGFRIMDETAAGLTEAKLNALGAKIKTLFGVGNGYLWKRGRKQLVYNDPVNGYQNRVLCFSQTEGKNLISKLLDIRNKNPDWKYASLSENLEESQAFPTIPEKQQILGKNRKLARNRVRADVRFSYAYIEIAGLPNKIYLYDHSGLIDDAIVKR